VVIPPPVTDLDIALTCADSDSDGIPDILESYFGISDPNGDADGDGMTNLEELNLGTDPQSPDNVDGDGDGCVNLKKVSPGNYEGELSSSEQTGGRRDGANQWDFFDPDKSVGSERIHRVGDILAVGNHYHLNDADYNRSYVGPNDWNLGPPDGLINIEDVLFARAAYFNDCS
jgi:hypothetical protein